jgi:hypothetical protein
VARHPEAVLTGEHDIENDEVGRDLGQLRKKRLGAVGGVDGIPLAGKVLTQQLADSRIVIHHPNARLAHRFPC